MKRAALLLAGCALSGAAVAQAADEKLEALMQRARERAAGVAAATPGEAQLAQRARLLREGESALAARDVDKALRAFEGAASIQHTADSEMGLVRTYMQGGEYRRALAFVAHTAAAHREVPTGAVLYAWLLRIGGQDAAAKRLLEEAQTRMPGDPMLEQGRALLGARDPLPTGPFLAAPARLAPYGAAADLPRGARVGASGVLVDEGRRVIAPLSSLSLGRGPGRGSGWGEGPFWVRNGLGDLARAEVEKRDPDAGIAVLRLARPLPWDAELAASAADPFPGSIAFTVEYVESPTALPAWPLLSGGFVGAATPDGRRKLGIDMAPGPRGGPVFDASGRLLGMALRGTSSTDQLMPASQLRASAGAILPAASISAPRASVDRIYEGALRVAVQVIVPATVITASTSPATIGSIPLEPSKAVPLPLKVAHPGGS